MARKGFYRLYRRGGVLTMERIRGTYRVFFSLHYEADVFRVNQIRAMRAPKARQTSWHRHDYQIGRFGFASLRKVRSGPGGPEAWELQRWQLGRLGPGKQEWRAIDTGLVEGNEWQSIAEGDDAAIERWINRQMKRASCVIVLIGSETAHRRWVSYEIKKAWADRKGVLGIYVHNLVGTRHKQAPMGEDPFEGIVINGRHVSEVIKVYNPPFTESTKVYNYIRENLDSWIEHAIEARNASQI